MTLRHYTEKAIYPTCPACGREGERVTTASLVERYGPDADLDDILRRFRCSACGRRGRPRVTIVWIGLEGHNPMAGCGR